MFDLLGLRHRFFLPLGRRIAVVGAIGAWALLEFWQGNPGWALAAFALAAVCAVEFFVLFDRANYGDKND